MTGYIGRFAPSPSGPLHFGSLVTALFSYLHAKQHNGQWLVRIEDIDVPRSVPGADQLILDSLQHHGLNWDGTIVYQSQRTDYYQRVLSTLNKQTYFCTCTRAQIKTMGGIYNRRCRYLDQPDTGAAIRFIHQQPETQFNDLLQGPVTVLDAHAREDFVVRRRDGLFAYHLAVVCDDIEQQVTHIVRGADLMDTTCSHLALYRALNYEAPSYMHLPVICSAPGKKLSKQNHAPALDNASATNNLIQAISILGFSAPTSLHTASPQSVIEWAIEHVKATEVPQKLEMIVPIA